MKNKKIALFVCLCGSLCLLIPSFGALIYGQNLNPSLSNQVSDGDDICVVTFKGLNGADTIEYFDRNYELSLKDAPFTKYGENYYTWKDESSGEFINNHIVLTKENYVFRPIGITNSQTANFAQKFWESYASGMNEAVNANGKYGINTAYEDNSSHGYDIKDPNNYQDDSYLAGLDHDIRPGRNIFLLNMYSGGTFFYVKGDNGAQNPDSLPNYPEKSIYNTDEMLPMATRGNANYNMSGYNKSNGTIGLETFAADYAGEEKYNKYYKPVNLKNTSYVSNGAVPYNFISEYCVSRITLNCDVIVAGNLTLGGLNGFLKQDTNYGDMNWTQLNYQGLIVGGYCEIDLNGYDLVLEEGGMIDSFGSITDSSREGPDGKTGTIVLRNGATMYSPLVFEDMWRENSIPEIYVNGMDFLQMFRCPYLDCTIKFEYGSKFYGKLYISYGKNGQSHVDLPIIGPCGSGDVPVITPEESGGECFWIQMREGSGSITRFCFYNESLYNEIGSNSVSNKSLSNVSYMKIRYTFVDISIYICGYYLTTEVAGDQISISSKKCQKWIPPYFDIYSYNSDITFFQEYCFMPGCYLYADSSSTLRFSHSSFRYNFGDHLSYGNSDFNYSAGGLNLCFEIQHFSDGNSSHYQKGDFSGDGYKDIKGWFDTRKRWNDIITVDHSYQGTGSFVYNDWNNFWNFYKNKPAVFDCGANLVFDEGNAIPYILSGQINFSANSEDVDATNLANFNVQLYGSTALSGPSVAAIGTFVEINSVNIMGFNSSPLISNGLVSPLALGLDDGFDCIYNPNNGIITARNDSGITKYYAFIFDDPNSHSDNVYYSFNGNSGGSTNSLSGSYKEVTMTSAFNGPAIIYQSHYYIYYDGAFIPFNFDGTGSVMKFNGHYGSVQRTGVISHKYYNYSFRNFSYNTSLKKWTISSSVSYDWSWSPA